MSRVSMPNLLLLIVLVIGFLCVSVSGAVPGDEITSLPGWTGPLPSKHYSGFFPVTNMTSYLHYWLALSENDPTNDPLVVWLQGGPGCSSLFGLLYENGPLHFSGQVDSSGLPTLVYNPYTWTKVANMLWLEQPVGVGFSYCAAGAQCSWDPYPQAAYEFFLKFFAAYPELANNKFHISGESYAGVWVPNIADAILTGNAGGQNKSINLVSILVGNGLGGNAPDNIQSERQSDFFYGHAMFPFESQQAINAACGNWSNISPQCNSAVSEASSHVGDYYIYNIYDDCPHNLLAVPLLKAGSVGNAPVFSPPAMKNSRFGDMGFVCILESVSSVYLNTTAVQQAIHVTAANVSDWNICGDGTGKNADILKSGTEHLVATNQMEPNQDLGALYLKLIKQIPVLIYSGDCDQCVPYYYSDGWVKALGFNVTRGRSWQPWTYQNGPGNTQVGGYVTNFDNANGLTLLTIKDSGHMVPQYAPSAALAFFTTWLKGGPF